MTETDIHPVFGTAPGSGSDRGATSASTVSGAPVPAANAAVARWQDWSLATKLAAVTLVPVVFAIVLGAMQIADQVDRADSYRRVDRLVAVNEQVRGLVDTLQRERGSSAVLLAVGARNPAEKLADERRSTDTARDGLLSAARRASFANESTATGYDDLVTRLDGLPLLRQRIAVGDVDPADTVASYGLLIDALLDFGRAATAEVIDPTLTSTSAALHDLEVVKEQIYHQHAVVAVGIARGALLAAEVDALRVAESVADGRLEDFRSVAGRQQQRAYAATVTGPDVDRRAALVRRLAAGPPGVPLLVTAQDWDTVSARTGERISDVNTDLGRQLTTRSDELQNEASDGAGLASVILLFALVVAAAVMIVLGRHLVRSLSQLRHSALEMAERRLPEAVERIRDAGDGPQAAVPEPVPVPVRSKDEVGQVARAFEAVHRQALRLATEQAGLRARYSNVFVNLSRRSQGLVQRQLQLLERLERDEEDADQLATLFQLDHLATRMRRNNENLMVISGNDLGRRTLRPTTLADLLRAAVSEIEQYPRVVLLPPPDLCVVGYAVGDLVRLLAELLDNATVFSAPSTQVTVVSQTLTGGALGIVVHDEGIGMGEEELAQANAKLRDRGAVDVSTSRRMGLFVVGRLAARHGIDVVLGADRGKAGVRVSVTVPAELVAVGPEEPDIPIRPLGRPSALANGNGCGQVLVSANGSGPASLPRRVRSANGVRRDISRVLDSGAPVGSAESGSAEPGAVEPGSVGPGTVEPGTEEPGTVEPAPEAAPASGRPVPSGNGKAAGWWATGPGHARHGRSAVEETTPIFDEMISAWFRSLSGPAPSQPDQRSEQPRRAEPRGENQWQFAADAGFEAAQAVSQAEPVSFTESGLPRRRPQQQLVPGSAKAAEEGHPLQRDADDLRGRLSSYQNGISRARALQPGAGRGVAAGGDEPDPGRAGWRFATDDRWQAFGAASSAAPDAVTPAGLPRRGTNRTPPPGADRRASPDQQQQESE